jgi:hypothetical protein
MLSFIIGFLVGIVLMFVGAAVYIYKCFHPW